ncbi:3-ketoacyl-ACP reductase [Betaproteobacteria bacterium]|nr:3-ketoacyl-ACP reductase [Betaproteobacteria bacterium]
MQKVLITGASIGIGRQTAIKFAEHGAQIVINYRNAEEDARETLRLVEKSGGKGYLVQADISNELEADRLVNTAAECLGGLDVLINNAGVTKFIPFEELDAATAEVWDFLYKSNVESMFFCCRAASKIMNKQNGGSIVNLASVAGMLPAGSSIPYSVSKAAIIHLTKCLANVLAPTIRVNSIAPGTIQNTRWNASNPAFDPEKYQARAVGLPLQRLGTPEDIAAAAYFLASDEASFITGANLPIDGGVNIK